MGRYSIRRAQRPALQLEVGDPSPDLVFLNSEERRRFRPADVALGWPVEHVALDVVVAPGEVGFE